jgi:hypothetical protein
MEVEFREPVGGTSDELLLGSSSWDNNDRAIKYGWPDKRGRIARGGEVPVGTLPQMVTFAVRNGYLSRSETAGLVKDLVDLLAQPS